MILEGIHVLEHGLQQLDHLLRALFLDHPAEQGQRLLPRLVLPVLPEYCLDLVEPPLMAPEARMDLRCGEVLQERLVHEPEGLPADQREDVVPLPQVLNELLSRRLRLLGPEPVRLGAEGRREGAQVPLPDGVAAAAHELGHHQEGEPPQESLLAGQIELDRTG